MKRILATLALLAGCSPAADTAESVGLDWQLGETFYVGATYRVANTRNAEISPADLNTNAVPDFDGHWSQELFWAYQVVESGLVPEPSDDLYDYALRPDGTVAPLAVVRAYIDRELNLDTDLSELDPVVYLVFREDRDRLAAIVQFTNVDGARVERAWTTHELGRSWSALSQSMLTAAPTYLAPFATPRDGGELRLGNGSTVASEVLGDGVIEATYPDEIGGGIVRSQYEDGQPWPVLTRTDNVVARLLTDSDVNRRRADLPPPPPNEPPPDYDFRAALASSIDIDSALTLGDTIDTAGYRASAPTGYRPWAGNWWPLRSAELVFGWRADTEPNTFSDLGFDAFSPLKTELEQIAAELRDLEGDERTAKVEEYREKQSAYVDELVDFYNDLLQDLLGGQIVIEDGIIEHTVDGWAFIIDDLSPMDKYALHRYLDGQTSPNPFFLSAWELLNSWAADQGGDNSWFGHCNGWAAAAILEDEPRESVTATAADGTVFTYETADLKGLTSELHYNVYSRFYGQRYNDEEDDRADMHPKPFHQLITFYLRDQQVPLVFDTDSGPPVWNFPAWGADVTLTETTEGGFRVNINTASPGELVELPGVGDVLAERIVLSREELGPFQDTRDIQRVQGIGRGRYSDIADLITVDAQQRTFQVSATVRYTTDGVDTDHIDSDPDAPQGFSETYGYTLVTDMHGLVVSGTWDDEENHPDFAWIPYNNPLSEARGGGENPYIGYRDYLNKVVDLRRE